jgi:hypothetical protein
MKKTIYALLVGLQSIIFAQAPTVGLIQHNSGSLDSGYVFFAPIRSDTTYLIDKCGKKVHQWKSGKSPGLSAYLLPDGSVLRTEVMVSGVFNSNGAAGGKIEKIDWNGNVLWSYTISDVTQTQNHDVFPLANGNILVSVWVNTSTTTAIAAGRDPSILGTSLWSAKIIELQPIGSNSANIVWQWDVMDHLVQDYDNTKSNYGVVTDHPELLNLNFNGTNAATSVDWLHLNAVTYNASLNQIMFSFHNLSEIYIIDHSTTTVEAASHAGGAHGKGGDFLYRWGNPQSCQRGTVTDRKLFLQHNPTWIPQGFKDAGKIMIFNNGNGRPGGNASSVDIISPPMDSFGNYSITSGQPYNPVAPDWTYMDIVPSNFYAQSMGSAQRLSNGNTLIDEATTGKFFEIDSLKNIIWEYINPVSSAGAISQGTTSTSTQVFRSVFYPYSYQGFIGQTLVPGSPIELNPYTYTCNLATGINEVMNEHSLALFPNPTSDYFSINIKGEEIKYVEVMNALGQIILTKGSTNSPINITETPNGLYLVKVITSNNHYFTKRMIKN